jgi:hypothetical protein
MAEESVSLVQATNSLILSVHSRTLKLSTEELRGCYLETGIN